MALHNSWTFTAFDKAIVAAVIAPLLSLGTSWVQGGDLDAKTLIAALVSGLIAGVGVYLKANARRPRKR